jgi:hypothetical protein
MKKVKNQKLEKYNYEYTDTFGGEANYCWVKRGEVLAKNWLGAVRKVKTELELNGVKCKREFYGDMIRLVPYRTCTVVFISEDY